jgi:hypothetical protein
MSIDLKCVKCECEGLHACTGRPLPPPTAEEEERLAAALDALFNSDVSLNTGFQRATPWTLEEKIAFGVALAQIEMDEERLRQKSKYYESDRDLPLLD